MVIKVEFSVDSTCLSYDVEHHVDGLFIAKMNALPGRIASYQLPRKIYLYRTPAGWKGDHRNTAIIEAIGGEVDKVIKGPRVL